MRPAFSSTAIVSRAIAPSKLELPVLVARRIGLKIDVLRAACEDAIFTGHEPPFIVFSSLVVFLKLRLVQTHNSACF